MNTMLLKLYVKLQDLATREEGQDLVEYAMLISLIALGCITATKALSTYISTAFSTIATSLTTNVT
jgi:pilus assembly protein Flp/PilA